MIQWLRYILQWSIEFVASVYVKKNVINITRKVYLSIKTKQLIKGTKQLNFGNFALFNIEIRNCYGVGNNVRKFQVSTMKMSQWHTFEVYLDDDPALS